MKESTNQTSAEKSKTYDARLLSFTAVAAIIGAGLAAGVGASAYGGMMRFGPENIDAEEREKVETAILNNDFEAWSDLMENHCSQSITQERFAEVVERHKDRDAIEEAIEAGDYDTWVELSSEFDRGRAFEVITKDTFPTFVEMHKAMESGDFERAEELREELGLAVRPQDGTGRGDGQKRGMGRGMGMGR